MQSHYTARQSLGEVQAISYPITPQTALYSPLGMPKPLKMGSWGCGGGKEGGKERGESKVVQGR